MEQQEHKLTNEQVRDELERLIESIDKRNEQILDEARSKCKTPEEMQNVRLRSTPYLSLKRRGFINADYLIAEFDKIQERTSKHNSSERKCITNLVLTAFHNAAVKAAKTLEDINNQNEKTDEEEKD